MYDGNAGDDQIAQQIAVLNQAYGPVGFAFQLAATDRVLNSDWFANIASNSQQEAAAQAQLHAGGLTTVHHPGPKLQEHATYRKPKLACQRRATRLVSKANISLTASLLRAVRLGIPSLALLPPAMDITPDR